MAFNNTMKLSTVSQQKKTADVTALFQLAQTFAVPWERQLQLSLLNQAPDTTAHNVFSLLLALLALGSFSTIFCSSNSSEERSLNFYPRLSLGIFSWSNQIFQIQFSENCDKIETII